MCSRLLLGCPQLTATRSVLSYMDIHMSCSNITRKYFGFGLCDPLVLHTALGVTAMMFSIALPNPKKGFNEAYKQKALAIPGVHERLEANDISNAVVGAIANLAQMEVSQLLCARPAILWCGTSSRETSLTHYLQDYREGPCGSQSASRCHRSHRKAERWLWQLCQ